MALIRHLGLEHHFNKAQPKRTKALYGLPLGNPHEQEEWWETPISSSAEFLAMDSLLTTQVPSNHPYPLLMEGSAVQLHSTQQTLIQTGYHGTASDRLKDILDNGFKQSVNVKCGKFGVYLEPENTRHLITTYVSYVSSLPSRPSHLIGSALVCHYNPRYTERPCPGSHQRVAKVGALMPVALVTHFLDGRQICDSNRKACYHIHRGEFEKANISLARWLQHKEEVKKKHQLKIEQDRENKRRKVSSSSSDQAGTGLESVTHQTGSSQVASREGDVPGVELPVHIVSRDPDTGCIQIETEGERPQIIMD